MYEDFSINKVTPIVNSSYLIKSREDKILNTDFIILFVFKFQQLNFTNLINYVY